MILSDQGKKKLCIACTCQAHILLTLFRWQFLWSVLVSACPRRCCYTVKVLRQRSAWMRWNGRLINGPSSGPSWRNSLEFLSGQFLGGILKYGEVVSLFLTTVVRGKRFKVHCSIMTASTNEVLLVSVKRPRKKAACWEEDSELWDTCGQNPRFGSFCAPEITSLILKVGRSAKCPCQVPSKEKF